MVPVLPADKADVGGEVDGPLVVGCVVGAVSKNQKHRMM